MKLPRDNSAERLDPHPRWSSHSLPSPSRSGRHAATPPRRHAAAPPRRPAAPPRPRPIPPLRHGVSRIYTLAGPGKGGGGSLSPRRIVHRQFQSAPSKNSPNHHPKADSNCRRTMKSQTDPIARIQKPERPGKRVANRGPFQLASGNPKAAPGQIGPAQRAHQSEQRQFSRRAGANPARTQRRS